MTQSINTSYGVIVLGDRDTTGRREPLVEAATDQGAVIAETFAFDAGEPASHDDLVEVEVVVAAIGRAISTRTDVWVPFPHQDLGREQHLRRLILVLQRHGLNVRIGRELEPCPEDGGFNEIDFALRREVRAVDALDHAALATAGAEALSAQIERALAEHPADSAVQSKSEKFFSRAEVARLFGKRDKWVYQALCDEIFTYPDGSVIEPIRIGTRRLRRFSVAVVQDMAWSCYRRGIFSDQEVKEVLAELRRAR